MDDIKQSPLTRRAFLQAAGGAAACWALLPLSGGILAADPLSRTPILPKSKARVGLVFVHVSTPRPTWPTKDYDYAGREKQILGKLLPSCPGIDFNIKRVSNANEAQAVLQESGEVDGYLVYVIGLSAPGAEDFVRSGKPVVLVDDLYGGTGQVLSLSGIAAREKLKVVTVSSSDMNDVIAAARLFGVIRAMKETTILDVTDRDITAPAKSVADLFGANVVRLTPDELADYFSKADEHEAVEWADYWIKGAKKMVEPDRAEIIKSGKMYLGLCRAAADRRADAVTMNCLGLFYAKKSPAYPCLSFFQMNNDGGTGICEGDINSTCTQLMMRFLTGRPGYVSDPVIDTSKNEVIYAHCVCTNRVFGPKGKANPYIIRSHAEDEQGAAVQSLLPVDEPVTTLEISIDQKRMVIHSAKAVGNSDEPKACRTKLVAKTNAKRLLKNWDLGWHRVTVYGDWREQAINLGQLYGFDVLEEDLPA